MLYGLLSRKYLQVETAPYTLKAKPIGSTQARVDSISTFWNRLNGAYNLKINDITRIERLGKNAVPGTPNCRLVGGRWRYLERPVEGDSIYTDCKLFLVSGREGIQLTSIQSELNRSSQMWSSSNR